MAALSDFNPSDVIGKRCVLLAEKGFPTLLSFIRLN